jgi:TolA-binding protein
MNLLVHLRGIAVATALAGIALPVVAQDTSPLTTSGKVRAEVSEAMEAIADYSAQERDQALTQAREALDRLDAVIERREQALRENWAGMSEAARETARARLRDLREARNTLGERYGALKAGAGSAWEELKSGFSDAWSAFSEAWSAAGDESSAD